ncbi:MAG: TldD/PmbA family protein [Nitrospiraceae bacterium]
MSSGLTSRQEFEFLTDLVLKHSSGDDTVVSLWDSIGGTTRFANNQVIQNVNARRVTLTVTVAFGRRRGTASTTELTAGAVQDALKRAERIARVSLEDPEYLPSLPQQTYLAVPSWRAETSSAGPARRLADARRIIEMCQGEGLNAAGIVATSDGIAALSTSQGLRAYEPRTEARFSVTVMDDDASAWASNAHRSCDQLAIEERTRLAVRRVKCAGSPRALAPGRYTVVLEPAAVAGLLSWMIWLLDAKSYEKGTSPFSGKLGYPLIDPRLNLHNLPLHPDLLGMSFDSDAVPSRELLWIQDGMLRQLGYDRFTAHTKAVPPISLPEAPCLSGDGIGDDLIATTERGILVSNLWYLRVVNLTDLTLTGMTRDGTFLIENGQIAGAIHNFRFHDSPVRAFSNLEECTHPAEAVTAETGKMLVPAMRIRDFHFSSTTIF